MALKTADLMRLELLVRTRAEYLKGCWTKEELVSPETPQVVRSRGEAELREAADFNMIGDLLMGLQGCWDRMADEVRMGHKRMAAAFEKSKRQTAPGAEGSTVIEGTFRVVDHE